jgi:hypothetical protein
MGGGGGGGGAYIRGAYIRTTFGVSNNIYCTCKQYRERKEIQCIPHNKTSWLTYYTTVM